ncbi:MAG: phospholipid/cholesterol/gamma-HCH transport system ATP-binding protein [Chthoniobacter sp.]|jgi:phospholipid/cholesterol/gamma-HCH transport system ATP-binding protein|nr:phospholipid/cholesterol/gamma-HCH transport system ATP-binding protein [Chthoniobacter sp.]
MAAPLVRIHDLHKRLGRQHVLRGFDLDVTAGETLVIIGRSGGGKSVLLKHIIGLMKPTSGKVVFEGQDVSELSERKLGTIRKKIAILFQGAALFDSMSVEENIAFPLKEAGIKDTKIIDEKVARALEVVDLAGEQKKMPENLSGGMKKRVGLARAIVSEPECILYDEPTTGLDPIVADSINRLIRRLQSRLRVTSIVVTHDMKSAFHVADQVAYLHEGRVYFKGTPEQLRASPDLVIQDFIEGRSHEIA